MAVVKKIKTVFQFRRGTTEEWNLNSEIIPAAGEPCFDVDLGTLRIGNGKSYYKDLKIIGGATISEDGSSLIVEGLQEDIEELQALVGETSVADQIANAMANVATADALETVVNNMTTLESKVTTSTDNVTEIQTLVEQNNTIVNELQTVVEQKADAATVVELQTIVENKADTETVTELQTIVEQKADATTVTELQTVVENKVDTAAVEALETELRTYIDEVINNVEASDMDGGVIE